MFSWFNLLSSSTTYIFRWGEIKITLMIVMTGTKLLKPTDSTIPPHSNKNFFKTPLWNSSGCDIHKSFHFLESQLQPQWNEHVIPYWMGHLSALTTSWIQCWSLDFIHAHVHSTTTHFWNKNLLDCRLVAEKSATQERRKQTWTRPLAVERHSSIIKWFGITKRRRIPVGTQWMGAIYCCDKTMLKGSQGN